MLFNKKECTFNLPQSHLDTNFRPDFYLVFDLYLCVLVAKFFKPVHSFLKYSLSYIYFINSIL